MKGHCESDYERLKGQMQTNKNALEILQRLNACADAQEWVGIKTPQEAWESCSRGDWLLWLAGRLEIDRKLIVLAACDCARLALPCVPKGELRPLKAIETAEAWARGEASLEDVAAAAAYAANAAAAAYAANAAAYAAADAANAAAYAANAAADAAAAA